MIDRRAMACAVCIAIGVPCAAQTSRPDTPAASDSTASPPAAPDGDGAILAGPTVPDEASRGPDFDPSRRVTRVTVVPLNRWLRVYNGLDLSAAQRDAAREIMRERRAALEAFRAEHGEEMGALRQQARRARTAGEPVPEDIRTRMQRLGSLAPRPADCQEPLWDLLDDTQQERLRATLTEIRRALLSSRSAARRIR